MSSTTIDPAAAAPQLVYVTRIRTTPAKLWEALTQPDFIRQYFFGRTNTSSWIPGEAIESRSPEGELEWHGTILKCVPEQEVVFTFKDIRADEGPSTVTYRIDRPDASAGLADPENYVQLTVIHNDFPVVSKIREQVSNGWPGIVAGIKTLLETGSTEVLAATCHYE